MYFLTYVSSATTPFTREGLVGLLQVCLLNNRRDGITGMLLYKDDPSRAQRLPMIFKQTM